MKVESKLKFNREVLMTFTPENYVFAGYNKNSVTVAGGGGIFAAIKMIGAGITRSLVAGVHRASVGLGDAVWSGMLGNPKFWFGASVFGGSAVSLTVVFITASVLKPGTESEPI